MGKSRISVVIPTLNEGKYLGALLESIKKQTYKRYEIIVIDSHSTDKTVGIAKKYHSRKFYFKRGNIAAAKNVGIKNAKGDIIAFIDADMTLSNGVFASIVREFEKDKEERIAAIEPKQELSLAGISRKNIRIFTFVTWLIRLNKSITFATGQPAATGCVFCRATSIKRAGMFNVHLKVSEDREYYSRLRKHGKFIIINDVAFVSFRRQEKEGLIRPALKYYAGDLSALLFKKVDRGMKPER